MQHQVPQFIEIEDKIFGPLTFKQFAYLAGGVGACILFFTLMPFIFAAVLSMPFLAFSLALAFYKVNGKPFIESLENALIFYMGGKLYLWRRRQVTSAPTAEDVEKATMARKVVVAPIFTESKLKDLAWSLNIKEKRGR